MMETIDPLHFVPVAIRQRTEILRGRIADGDHAIDTDDDRRDEQDHADRHDDGKDRHQEEQQEEHHRADIELLHQIDEQQHAVQRGCADHRTDQPRHAQQRPDRFLRHPVELHDLIDQLLIYDSAKQQHTDCRADQQGQQMTFTLIFPHKIPPAMTL